MRTPASHLVTTSAMIFGMLPHALRVGEVSEQRAGMAHVATCGIITLAMLTLVVVPMLHTYLDDLSRCMRSRRGRQASGT